MRQSLAASLLALASAFVVAEAPGQTPAAPTKGIVVEEVDMGQTGEQAGLRPGDILMAWVRPTVPPAAPGDTKGAFDDPFDLAAVQVEEAPLGRVTLSLRRGDEDMSIALANSDWGIKVRPRLPADAETVYLEGQRQLNEGRLSEGLGIWRGLAQQASSASDWRLGAWLLVQVGERHLGAGQLEESARAFAEAAALVEKAGDPPAQARVLDAHAEALDAAGRPVEAAEAYRRALGLRRERGDRGLAMAAILNRLGAQLYLLGDLPEAQRTYEEALTIRSEVAPESLELASTLNNLGLVALGRFDLSKAKGLLEGALALRERLAPGALDVSKSLSNLSLLRLREGNAVEAQALAEQALVIVSRLAPGNLAVAYNLNNLGEIALGRGDLAQAEAYYRRGLAAAEAIPSGASLAVALHINVAISSYYRGDLDAAETGYKNALDLATKVTPDSDAVALILMNLGEVARDRGDWVRAEDLDRKALNLFERLDPGGVKVGEPLDNLATLALDRGDLIAAQRYAQNVLAVFERGPHGTPNEARAHATLGRTYLLQGRLDDAERHLGQALAIIARQSPETEREAVVLDALADVQRRRGNPEAARALLDQALQALDAQGSRLGGSAVARAGFGARHRATYRRAIDLHLAMGRQRGAFQLLERSRAQALLAMLAQRDLLAPDVPTELEMERRRAGAEYERTLTQLAQAPEADQHAVDRLLTQLNDLRAEREAIAERIRLVAPRTGALRHPRALDVSAARATLDRGTLLLSYSVGQQETLLFVVTDPELGKRQSDELAVFKLPVGEEMLRREVEAYRNLLGSKATSSSSLRQQGVLLYQQLLAPAAGFLQRADRLLVIPDGPLHLLPFAALRSRRGYLAESKPVHTVLSATVYAELKRARAPHGRGILVAFGDPVSGPTESTRDEIEDVDLRSARVRGVSLGPLPSTRREVETIAKVFRGEATIYVGAEATEERAKSLPKDARLVHFACHAFVDERFPLDSALVLSIPEKAVPGQENGLLRAWEVMERVRLDANLVTLSACETGLGKVLGGDGIVGLVQAFQYAGARSVLASLWKVGDESTAELMRRFYANLKKGKTKDEALRLAQVALIRDPLHSHPFHWAAFELIGDWR